MAIGAAVPAGMGQQIGKDLVERALADETKDRGQRPVAPAVEDAQHRRVRALADEYDRLWRLLATGETGHWGRADQQSVRIVRIASDHRWIDSHWAAARVPSEVLHTLDELWRKAGAGPLRGRPWTYKSHTSIFGPAHELGITSKPAWYADKTYLTERLDELRL